jgi:hypothetical protein
MSKRDVRQELGLHAGKSTPADGEALEALSAAFEQSPLSIAQRFQAFPRHVRRQDLARFLARYELFKLCQACHGNVVECGVFTGGGVMAWAHFSAILEPYNHTRRIIGFDTFSGFPAPGPKDTTTGRSEFLKEGALEAHASIQQEIEQLAAIHDRNRPLGHIPKVELVAGDACETIPKYVVEHPHAVFSLLYLDFDLYEPTKTVLEHLWPRVVAGGIVAFDQVNCAEFPGETTALVEVLGLEKVALRRFAFDPYISYFVKQ